MVFDFFSRKNGNIKQIIKLTMQIYKLILSKNNTKKKGYLKKGYFMNNQYKL